DRAVERHRVRTAVRQREKAAAAGVRDARAHSAQPVARHAVLERRGGLGRQILVGSADAADRDQVDARLGRRRREQRAQQQWKQLLPFHFGFPSGLLELRRRLFCATIAKRLRLPYGRLKKGPRFLIHAVSDFRATFAQRRSRVAKAACAALAFLLWHPLTAQAWPWEWDETKPALRVTVGVDVFRVPGTTVASARYGGSWNAKISTWLHDAGVDPH